MRFWDSSALVTLFVAQKTTSSVRDLYASDPQVVAWTLSDVEMRSALVRLEREGALAASGLQEAVKEIETFWPRVNVVTLVESVKSRAKRLLGVHALRAADALQLGAALAVTTDDPRGFGFVSLDSRLTDAARKEGFAILP
jgi:predicted nucleic acid-binding protein